MAWLSQRALAALKRRCQRARGSAAILRAWISNRRRPPAGTKTRGGRVAPRHRARDLGASPHRTGKAEHAGAATSTSSNRPAHSSPTAVLTSDLRRDLEARRSASECPARSPANGFVKNASTTMPERLRPFREDLAMAARDRRAHRVRERRELLRARGGDMGRGPRRASSPSA